MSLFELESRLHYHFVDSTLLQRALTHRSYSATHNERLEFLGDAILNGIISALLFARFPQWPEGDLSRMRSGLVNQKTLCEQAQHIALAPSLKLGAGERKTGGRERPSMLADAFEAILGAVYLDGGFDAVHTVIATIYEPILSKLDPCAPGKDAKTQLQEYLQHKKIALPEYTMLSMDDSAVPPVFEVQCAILDLKLDALGVGATRRLAEQVAAHAVLEMIKAKAPAKRRVSIKRAPLSKASG